MASDIKSLGRFGKAHIEMFPKELIALSREVSEHPKLIELLAEHWHADWTVRLACIAAYCEVILDGVYSETDIRILADTLTGKLKDKRKLIVIEGEGRTITVVPHLEAPSKDDPAAGGKIVLNS